MNIKKFAIIDMLFLTALAVGSEVLGHIINPSILYISFAQVFLILLAVRWRSWSLIPIAITAIAKVIIYKAAGINEIIVYLVPMLLMGLTLLVMKMNFFKKVNENKYTGILLFTVMFTLYLVSTVLLAKLFVSPDYSFLGEIVKNSITYIVGVILMFMFASQKTMLVDIAGNYKKNVKEREINGS